MRGSAGQVTPIRSVGGRVVIPDGARREEMNVVLVLRSDCPYCRASMAFYKRIGDLSRVSGSRLAVHVASTEDSDSIRGYLSKEGVSVDSVFSASMASLGVTGTPTILLANSTGVIKDEYVGMLTGSQEEQLLARLSRRTAVSATATGKDSYR
jgi:hypothetical protein